MGGGRLGGFLSEEPLHRACLLWSLGWGWGNRDAAWPCWDAAEVGLVAEALSVPSQHSYSSSPSGTISGLQLRITAPNVFYFGDGGREAISSQETARRNTCPPGPDKRSHQVLLASRVAQVATGRPSGRSLGCRDKEWAPLGCWPPGPLGFAPLPPRVSRSSPC